MTVARKNFAFAIEVAEPVRYFDRNSPGHRHVALMIEQALARQMNRDQRSGTGGLHGETGAGEIELVRDARREHVLVVAGLLQEKQPRVRDQFGVSQKIVNQVGVHARAGIDAYSPRELFCAPPRVLERLPCAFEEEPMLRIHDRGIPRAQPEEGRIETIDVIKDRRGPDVFRISKIRRGRARRDQLLIVKRADRFDAVAQIPPELTDIACSGESARHSDYGDRRARKNVFRVTHSAASEPVWAAPRPRDKQCRSPCRATIGAARFSIVAVTSPQMRRQGSDSRVSKKIGQEVFRASISV